MDIKTLIAVSDNPDRSSQLFFWLAIGDAVFEKQHLFVLQEGLETKLDSEVTMTDSNNE